MSPHPPSPVWDPLTQGPPKIGLSEGVSQKKNHSSRLMLIPIPGASGPGPPTGGLALAGPTQPPRGGGILLTSKEAWTTSPLQAPSHLNTIPGQNKVGRFHQPSRDKARDQKISILKMSNSSFPTQSTRKIKPLRCASMIH